MADKATPASRFQWEAGDFDIEGPSNEAEKAPETASKAPAEAEAEPNPPDSTNAS